MFIIGEKALEGIHSKLKELEDTQDNKINDLANAIKADIEDLKSRFKSTDQIISTIHVVLSNLKSKGCNLETDIKRVSNKVDRNTICIDVHESRLNKLPCDTLDLDEDEDEDEDDQYKYVTSKEFTFLDKNASIEYINNKIKLWKDHFRLSDLDLLLENAVSYATSYRESFLEVRLDDKDEDIQDKTVQNECKLTLSKIDEALHYVKNRVRDLTNAIKKP